MQMKRGRVAEGGAEKANIENTIQPTTPTPPDLRSSNFHSRTSVPYF